MKLGRAGYLTGIVCAVILASIIYILFVPEEETNGDPWRKVSLKIINLLERGLIRFADASSYVENYRIRRLLQALRTSLYRTPDNMHVDVGCLYTVNPELSDHTYNMHKGLRKIRLSSIKQEVAQIAVNGRPALHHCPAGDVSKQSLPGIVYFHGGSWISGSAAQWSPLTTYLSNTSGAIVISIDYRLSPEYTFPTAFEDCLKATRAILRSPGQYGIAFRQIALAGDDVGGNLALAIAHNLSKEIDDDPKQISDIKLVGMFYPALQSFDFTLPSYVRYKSGPNYVRTEDVISGTMYHLFGHNDHQLASVMASSNHIGETSRDSVFYKRVFDLELLPYSFQQWVAEDEPNPTILTNQTLQEKINNLIIDPRYSPMLLSNEDLTLLPKTYFISPEVDPKRDDSFFAYARLVEMDQTSTEHIYYPSERHGFLLDVADNAEARLALDKFGKHFNEVLKTIKRLADIGTKRQAMDSSKAMDKD